MSFSFSLRTSRLSWVTNRYRTRYFLVLSLLKPPSNELNLLLHATNKTSVAFGNSTIYDNPGSDTTADPGVSFSNADERASTSGTAVHTRKQAPPVIGEDTTFIDATEYFHVSIAWSLCKPFKGNYSDMQNNRILQNHLGSKTDVEARELISIEIPVTCIKVRIGNIVESITLEPKATDGLA